MTRALVTWAWNGDTKKHVYHAFPASSAPDRFTALCGLWAGALNGHYDGQRIDRCRKCRSLVKGYTDGVKAKQKAAHEKWKTTQTRLRLIDKAMKLIEDMCKDQLLTAIEGLEVVKAELEF